MNYNLNIKKELGVYTMNCGSVSTDEKKSKSLKKQITLQYKLEDDNLNILTGWISTKTKRYNELDKEMIEKYFPGMTSQLIERSVRCINNGDSVEIARELGYSRETQLAIERADSQFKIDLILRTAREAM